MDFPEQYSDETNHEMYHFAATDYSEQTNYEQEDYYGSYYGADESYEDPNAYYDETNAAYEW